MFTTKWVIINTLTGEAAKLDQLGRFQFWTSNDKATQYRSMGAASHIRDWLKIHEGMRNLDVDWIKI